MNLGEMKIIVLILQLKIIGWVKNLRCRKITLKKEWASVMILPPWKTSHDDQGKGAQKRLWYAGNILNLNLGIN